MKLNDHSDCIKPTTTVNQTTGFIKLTTANTTAPDAKDTHTTQHHSISEQLRFCIMLSYSIWHDDDDVTAQPTVAKTMIKVPSFQCGRHTCVAAGKRKAGVICNQCTVG